MPTYEYKCISCGYRFDVWQLITDKSINTCPECEGRLERLITGGSGFILHGSGFHCNDYPKDDKTKQEEEK